MAVTVLKASNYTCWPEAGGMLDQDSRMISDMLQFLSIERRVEYEQKALDASIEGKRDDNPDIVTEDFFS